MRCATRSQEELVFHPCASCALIHTVADESPLILYRRGCQGNTKRHLGGVLFKTCLVAHFTGAEDVIILT